MGKTAQTAGAPAQKTAKETPVQLVCTILENGMTFDGCHHAVGKVMNIPEAQARVLADLGKLRIDGAAV